MRTDEENNRANALEYMRIMRDVEVVPATNPFYLSSRKTHPVQTPELDPYYISYMTASNQNIRAGQDLLAGAKRLAAEHGSQVLKVKMKGLPQFIDNYNPTETSRMSDLELSDEEGTTPTPTVSSSEISDSEPKKVVSKITPVSAVPPPPKAGIPPAPALPAPPAMTNQFKSGPVPTTARTALLAQIEAKGAHLKPVASQGQAPKPDGTDALLSEIKKGNVQLRKVDTKVFKAQKAQEAPEFLVEALEAFAQRRRAQGGPDIESGDDSDWSSDHENGGATPRPNGRAAPRP